MSMYINPLQITVAPEAQLYRTLNAEVNPDPYVLKYNGRYYAYTTSGDGVTMLCSTDMIHWTHCGYAYQREGHADYWAPAVFYDNGLFYMYVSSRPIGEADVHYEYLQVAVAETPSGPFRFVKQLFSTFTIDAHVVRDTDGSLVMLYSTNETLGIDDLRPGTVILADRMIDPLTPEGNPKLIVKPTLDEEIYEHNRFGDGRNWHTIEGAFYLRHRDMHYIMYSGNAFTKPHYYIGYSTAQHQEGESITNLSWSKHPDNETYQPLLRQNEAVEGVGHNSVVKGPNNVEDWVIYHGRDRVPAQGDTEGGGDEERRQMRMDPLLWLGKELWVPGPSSTMRYAPEQPSFRELFDNNCDDTLTSSWHQTAGQWHVKDGELQQQSTLGKSMLLLKQRYATSLFEANVRWEPHHMGGLYGVVITYADDQHYAELLLDAGKRTIGLYEVMGGVKLPPQAVSVQKDFSFAAYHQLLIAVHGKHMTVTLDGIAVLTAKLQALRCGELPCFGLSTNYTSAYFSGVSLTGHLAFDRGTAVELMRYIRAKEGLWRIEGDALQGRSCGQGTTIELYNPFAEASSKLRLDLLGKLGQCELRLKLQSKSPSQHVEHTPPTASNAKVKSVVLPTAEGKIHTTLHLRHQADRLEIWYDRQLLVSEEWTEQLHNLTLDCSHDLTIEAWEWTVLSS